MYVSIAVECTPIIVLCWEEVSSVSSRGHVFSFSASSIMYAQRGYKVESKGMEWTRVKAILKKSSNYITQVLYNSVQIGHCVLYHLKCSKLVYLHPHGQAPYSDLGLGGVLCYHNHDYDCVERKLSDMPAMLLGNNVRVWSSFWESMHDVALKKISAQSGVCPAGGSGGWSTPRFRLRNQVGSSSDYIKSHCFKP